MRLISHKDRRIVMYAHVYKNIEGVGYEYKYYPQSSPPSLTDWQLKYLVEALEYDAKKLGLHLRHS